MRRHLARLRTITADNGTEFHFHNDVEQAGVQFFFATPHHSWERGTDKNTNGLVRQYLRKRTSMGHVTPRDCNAIATEPNIRPRKRYDYQTPEERFHAA